MNDNNFNNNNQQFNTNNISKGNNIANNQQVQNQNYTYVPQQNNEIPIINSNQTSQQNLNQQQPSSYSNHKEDKYYTDKSRGLIAFILLIISAILIFYFKILLGYLLTLIVFLFTIFNRKYIDSLLNLTKWLSLLLLIYFGIAIFSAFRYAQNMRNEIEESRIQQGYSCKTKIAEMTKSHVNELDNKPTSITIFNDNDFFIDIRNCMGFDWYVVYNHIIKLTRLM